MKTHRGSWLFTWFITSSALFAANGPDLATVKAELLKTDADFNARAAQEGPRAAFLAYIANDGSLLALGPDRHGADAVNALFEGFPQAAILTWKPVVADAAASGDFGYTEGTYELRVPGEAGAEPRVSTGKYMTVWKRQADGGWKFVLDGGTADAAKP